MIKIPLFIIYKLNVAYLFYLADETLRQRVGLGHGFRLGVDADDRLGVRFAQMNPVLREVDFHAVYIVHVFTGITLLYLTQYFIHIDRRRQLDLVLGNNQKRQIVTALDAYFEGRTFDDVLADVEKEQYEELEVSTVLEHTRAFVKVQDGCNQFCSYCIIPYARGRVRSRRMENVIAEIKRLAEAGIQEVVLTGIHLSSYGREIDGESHLIELIEAIHPIDGISRIRLGSLEPRIITEEFVGRLKKLHKVCPHFHLSLQSGCEETLKRMNRHYTPEEYYEKCKLLRAAFENPAITTDVIVGFPGETDEEFDKTRQFLEKVHFYEMHIFRYSRRKGTRADKMENQIPEETKAQRSGILSSLESQMTKEFRTKWTGACVKVLLEERQEINGVSYMVGHTPEYIKCAVETDAPDNTIIDAIIEGELTADVMKAR